MNTLEWYPWYWKDWRLSASYAAFTATERGIYRDLLDECWARDGFALDHDRLARACGCSVEDFTSAWATLQAKFKQDASGRYYNPEMATIKAAQVEKHERLAARGRKGGFAKALAQAGTKQKQAVAERERNKDFLSKGRNGAAPDGQERRPPNCEHNTGYWGELNRRPAWICSTCKAGNGA